MYVLMFVAGFITAIIFLLVSAEWRRKRRRSKRKAMEEQSGRIRKKTPDKKVKIDTYVKLATSIVLGHGLTMVTMSYVLAWFEKDAVADVSTTLITEIVAPLCLYIGTNCIMNIFEKNELSFSKPIRNGIGETTTHEEHSAFPDEDAAG